MDALIDLEPVERADDGRGMRELRRRNNSASKSVLNALETVKLGSREAKVKRIAVVKLRVYKRSCNSRGSGIVQGGANTTEITNVKETASGDRGNLFREGQVVIKDETKVAC